MKNEKYKIQNTKYKKSVLTENNNFILCVRTALSLPSYGVKGDPSMSS